MEKDIDRVCVRDWVRLHFSRCYAGIRSIGCTWILFWREGVIEVAREDIESWNCLTFIIVGIASMVSVLLGFRIF
jgi:hypothetical protein